MPRFRLAICGAGIGGLVLARVLAAHQDIDVQIFEAKLDATADQGQTAVAVYGKTVQVLKQLGLEDDYEAISGVRLSDHEEMLFRLRRSDMKDGVMFGTHLLGKGGGFQRGSFLGPLAKNVRVLYGKRLVSYNEGETITLHFADGSTIETDALIGCDGIRSVVRAHMFPDKPFRDPVWVGSSIFRAVIKASDLPESHPLRNGAMRKYLGKHQNIVSFSVARGKVVNFVAYVTQPELYGAPWTGPHWLDNQSTEELQNAFGAWEPEVRELVMACKSVLRWALHVTTPLPTFTQGHVALVGDAAHAMQPHAGAGANQTIEDAYTLAALLADPRTTRDTLHIALETYDAVRRPYAQRVALASEEMGKLLQLDSQYGEDLEAIDKRFLTIDRWFSEGNIGADVKEALHIYEQKLACTAW